MQFAAATCLLLSGLAAAAPALAVAVRRAEPDSTSTGVKWAAVAYAGSESHPLHPLVSSGPYLSGIHTGAGLSRATLGSSSTARVWYHNGTDADVAAQTDKVLSDGGTPPFPWGLDVQSPAEFDGPYYPSFHAVNIPAGGGPNDVGISQAGDGGYYTHLHSRLGEGAFIACQHSVPYYGNQTQFLVLDHLYDSDGVDPQECLRVYLVPVCDVLAELPPGSISSHEFVRVQACYSAIPSCT